MIQQRFASLELYEIKTARTVAESAKEKIQQGFSQISF